MSAKHRFARAGLIVGAILATASASMAAEPTLHVPATAQALQQIDLLQRTQHALTNLYASRDPRSVTHVANAWYYPTGQADTVFVQLTTGELLVVEMRGNRISQLRELGIAAPTDSAWASER
jgi:hypothetical protein